MPNEDVVKENAQPLQDKNRSLEERIQDAKDATLRLLEKNRHLQERVGTLESRVRFFLWLAVALFGGSVGLSAIIATRQVSQIQDRVATLQETLSPLQVRVEELDRLRKTSENGMAVAGEAKIEQVKKDLLESVKKMVPEILAAAVKDGMPVNPPGDASVGSANPAATLPSSGNLLGTAKGPANEALRIVVGRTDPQKTRWVQYSDGGIYVDIDTSSAGFSSTPYYFTSLGGHTNNWIAQGVTSVYTPTAKGFRVHIGYRQLTAAQAKDWGWYINWIAVGN